jgi:hypothetical protein
MLHMARWTKVLIAIAMGLVSLVVLSLVMDRGIGHGDAKVLEREIRVGLPLGSSLSTVDEFLGKRGIEHSFAAPSKTIYAIVRKTNGSDLLITEELTFRFHFDDALKLKSIDAKVELTGP